MNSEGKGVACVESDVSNIPEKSFEKPYRGAVNRQINRQLTRKQERIRNGMPIAG